MAEGGEEKAIFIGLRNDAQQALPDIAKQAGKSAEDTADGAEKGLTAHAVNESEITDSLHRIPTSDSGSALGKSVESTTADAEASTGKAGDILRRLSGQSGDEGGVLDDNRHMATETPSMGWQNYNDLSPKGKSLSRALDGDGVVDELLHGGRVLSGAGPTKLLPPVSEGELATYIRRMLRTHYLAVLTRSPGTWFSDMWIDQVTLACARAAVTLRDGRLITKGEALGELSRSGAPERLVADIGQRRYGEVRKTGLGWRIRRALIFRSYMTSQIRSLLAES